MLTRLAVCGLLERKIIKKTHLHSHNYLSFEVSYCDKILFGLKGRECMRKKKYWVSLDNNDKNDKTGPLDNTSVTATTHVCLKQHLLNCTI